MNGTKTSDGRTLGLPINSIDIAIIVDKNKKGDTSGEQSQGSHEMPPDNSSESVRAPDDDMGVANNDSNTATA
jgi:hypothetical protein